MSADRRSAARATIRLPGSWVARLALFAACAVGLFQASADPFILLLFASYGLVAAVLLVRQPRNAVSWIMLAAAFAFVDPMARHDPDLNALAAGTAAWGDFLIVWTAGWWGQAGYLTILLLTLVFPTGRFEAGRSRRMAIVLVVLATSAVVLAAFNPTLTVNVDGINTITLPNRLALFPGLPLWSVVTPDATVLVVAATVLVGTVGLVVRYRRSTGAARIQLRWLAVAVSSLAVAAVIGLAFAAFGIDAWLLAILAFLTIPLAIGFAELRYAAPPAAPAGT